MGRLYLINLEGRIYSCKHCQTHLALYEDIVSKVILSSISVAIHVFFFLLFFQLVLCVLCCSLFSLIVSFCRVGSVFLLE